MHVTSFALSAWRGGMVLLRSLAIATGVALAGVWAFGSEAGAQVKIEGLGNGDAVCTNSSGQIVSRDLLGTCNGSTTGTSNGDISGVKNLTGQGTGNISGFNNITATGTVSGGTGQFGTLSAGATTLDSLTVTGATATHGITNTGNITTDTLTTNGNAIVGGTLTVDGRAYTNGIVNDGLIRTDALHADYVNADHINADTVRADYVSADVVRAGVVNSYVSNSFETNSVISNSFVANNFVTNSAFVNAGLVNAGFVATHGLAVAPDSYVNMGNNVVQGVADPIHPYDAANKNYVDSGLSSAFREIDKNTQGIAIAMAMAGLMLPENKTYTLGANIGFFDDRQAIAVQGAVRLTPNLILNAGIGTGFQDTSTVGGRVGLQASW